MLMAFSFLIFKILNCKCCNGTIRMPFTDPQQSEFNDFLIFCRKSARVKYLHNILLSLDPFNLCGRLLHQKTISEEVTQIISPPVSILRLSVKIGTGTGKFQSGF